MEISKSSKLDGGILCTAEIAVVSGRVWVKLNWRSKQPFPADGTTFQIPRLKGPSMTHRGERFSPFAPKPLSPLNHKSEGPRQERQYVKFRY